MQLTFLGACKEVGRAGILVEEKESRILLDYGLKVNDELIAPLPVQGFLDGIIISHAHLDHSGYCPILYQDTDMPCYMTPPSLPLIDMLVKDSIKVQNLRGLCKIFTGTHLKRMLRNTIPVEYNKERRIGDFSFTLHDAGHILGAAYVKLQSKNSLIYTADIKFENTRLHKAAVMEGDVDFLIIESTYGSRNHKDRKESEKELVAACREVCDDNGNVLIPSFALGRAQEIACVLYKHNFEYPVFMDGMAKSAAEIMIDFPNYLRDFKEFYSAMKWIQWVDSPKKRKKALDEPSVIISTAGMLQGGPAVHYLLEMLGLPNQALFFVGFQPEGTPGKKILDTGFFSADGYNVNCKNLIIKKFDFSAHASSDELKNCAKKLNPKAVFVVHGDPEEASALAEWIKEKVGCFVSVPNLGERFNCEKYL